VSSTADLRSLVEALDEPTLLVQAGRIAVANQAARDIFGRVTEGGDVRLAIRHPAALDLILDGRSGDTEISGIGGAERRWLLSIRAAGGGLLMVRLTDRSAARAAEKMRVDFVANASHELRTPLSTILGYAETIADEAGLEPQLTQRFGEVIRSEARRMLRVVEDLMSLSRIEADRFVAPRDRVSPADLARFAAERAQPLAESRQSRIELDIDPDVPLLRGDEAQLLQLLDNLIANALRYGCPASGCAVHVAARRASRAVELEVRDSGDGIAPEHLPRLTERFYRVDEARSRDSGGTGLGLAIVKHIVERHRGSLDIRSAPGNGTSVLVTLPIE
jgi:two-component system phosphate regulon sensor histidine kinase PhoR